MKVTLAEVFAQHWPSYFRAWCDRMPESHYKAAEAIMKCRTGEAGTVYHRCEDCGRMETRPVSCGHRACNACGQAQVDGMGGAAEGTHPSGTLPYGDFHHPFESAIEKNDDRKSPESSRKIRMPTECRGRSHGHEPRATSHEPRATSHEPRNDRANHPATVSRQLSTAGNGQQEARPA